MGNPNFTVRISTDKAMWFVSRSFYFILLHFISLLSKCVAAAHVSRLSDPKFTPDFQTPDSWEHGLPISAPPLALRM